MKYLATSCILLFFFTNTVAQTDLELIMQKRQETIANIEGFPATSFQAPDTKGEIHYLENHQGQVIILHFWQLYCEPCWSQIKSLNKIIAENDDQSVVVLGFVDDYGKELEDYIANKPINYPVIPNSRDFGMEFFAGKLGYPRVFLIDKYGVVQKLMIGGKSYDDMDLYNELKPLIEHFKNQ